MKKERKSRLPASLWQRAISLVVAGASALQLQRDLRLGSYHTALRMAQRIRLEMALVSWPYPKGSVALTDDVLPVLNGAKVRVWILGEMHGGKLGNIRIERATDSPEADFERLAQMMCQSATVTTPKGGYLSWVSENGFKRSPQDPGHPALALLSALPVQFAESLSRRRHQGVNRSTLGMYLGEFVFRHNAAVLGWNEKQQTEVILQKLPLT